MYTYLSNMDLYSLINQSLSVNDMWNAFQLIIKSAIDNCLVACLTQSMHCSSPESPISSQKASLEAVRRKLTDKNMARYIQASKHLTETINRNHIYAYNALLSNNSHQFFWHVSKCLNAADSAITLKAVTIKLSCLILRFVTL